VTSGTAVARERDLQFPQIHCIRLEGRAPARRCGGACPTRDQRGLLHRPPVLEFRPELLMRFGLVRGSKPRPAHRNTCFLSPFKPRRRASCRGGEVFRRLASVRKVLRQGRRLDARGHGRGGGRRLLPSGCPASGRTPPPFLFRGLFFYRCNIFRGGYF